MKQRIRLFGERFHPTAAHLGFRGRILTLNTTTTYQLGVKERTEKDRSPGRSGDCCGVEDGPLASGRAAKYESDPALPQLTGSHPRRTGHKKRERKREGTKKSTPDFAILRHTYTRRVILSPNQLLMNLMIGIKQIAAVHSLQNVSFNERKSRGDVDEQLRG